MQVQFARRFIHRLAFTLTEIEHMAAREKYTIEDLQHVVDAVKEHGSQRKAAEVLGIQKSTVGHHMLRAAKLGLLGYEPVLPGYEVKTTNVSYDRDGNVIRTTVQQHKESGPEFKVPDGLELNGVSAYVDADKRWRGGWIKTGRDRIVKTTDLVEAFKRAFAGHKPLKIIRAPARTLPNLLQVYPIVDPHFGMLADGRETGLANDLGRATARVLAGIDDLVDRSPRAKHALVINTGDYFHADNQKNVTEASGHQLDVDSRHPKILIAGVETLIHIIERALQKHEFVEYKGLKGNHDPQSAVALTVALAMYFANNKRVKIDIEGRDFDFYWRLFGKNYIGATHGHNMKPVDMARTMADVNPDYWGASTHRWFIFGHIHHETVKRVGSVRCESFNQPVPNDAYAHSHFPGSVKDMWSVALRKEGGEYGRHCITFPGSLPYRAAA